MNELTTLSKYLFSKLTTDTSWSQSPINNAAVYAEIIPAGKKLTLPVAMTVTTAQNNTRNNFGTKLKGRWLLQIKAVMEGDDFSKLSPMANLIDNIFDWQNIIDPSTGRPKCQELWTDPQDNTINIRIMSSINHNYIKYSVNEGSTNYANLGGVYELEYYLE